MLLMGLRRQPTKLQPCTTNIDGTLTTDIGTISGKTSYLEINTGTQLPYTLDCSTANLNVTVLFYSGSSPGTNAFTLSNIQDT